MENKNNVKASILGFIVGDALGVPAEFKARQDLVDNPIVGMIGYGTHNQPPGTWSDDSSLMIITMEWLVEQKSLSNPDYVGLMEKFCRWMMYGEYTPYNDTFDIGVTVSRALMKYGRGAAPLESGGETEWENGNGSLMRILPIALITSKSLYKSDYSDKALIYGISSLTHAHARSKISCLIYCKLVSEILWGKEKDKVMILEKCMNQLNTFFKEETSEYQKEYANYNRIINAKEFKILCSDEIKSSGYVIDTLEAAVWSFVNTDSYVDCVLKAVNLGDDTDTVAAVAGGLAGAYYGLERIPENWIRMLAKRDWIADIVNDFIEKY